MTKWTATAAELGLDPTGATDDTSRVRDWMNQLEWVWENDTPNAPPKVRAGLLDLGVGSFRFDLERKKAFTLRGAGARHRKPATVIKGTIVEHYDKNPTHPSAMGSSLEGLALHGEHHVRTKVDIENVCVYGGGVEFIGTAGVGNVNQITVRNLVVEDANVGIYVYGADANAIEFTGCRAFGCGEGIADEAFLGCIWVGCAAEGCYTRGFRAHGQARPSTFLGCYSEQGGAALQDIVEQPNVWIGGTPNKGIGARPGKVPATTWIGGQFRGRVSFVNTHPTSGRTLVETIGGNDGYHGHTWALPDGRVVTAFVADDGGVEVHLGAWNGPLLWRWS